MSKLYRTYVFQYHYEYDALIDNVKTNGNLYGVAHKAKTSWVMQTDIADKTIKMFNLKIDKIG